jgi:hypothetical protein
MLLATFPKSGLAQQTNNSSALTNQAAPSASAVTTGGTNINYQTNNTYSNEVGFGPGVFCRTPTIFVGGNAGQNNLNAFDAVTESGNLSTNYAFNAGLVYPFGSSAIEDCKTLARTVARDREISTQLSMIKACADLEKKGIIVNPEIYPLLEPCTASVLKNNVARNPSRPPMTRPTTRPPARTAAPRPRPAPPVQKLPAKVPQTTKS